MIKKKPTPELGDFVYDNEYNVYMISVISSPFIKLIKVEPKKDKNLYVAFSEKIAKIKYIRPKVWEIQL